MNAAKERALRIFTLITSVYVYRKEISKISGEEDPLKESWVRYEKMAFLLVWSWVMR
jgi:hypothetical protein